jgi:hypothetical protein
MFGPARDGEVVAARIEEGGGQIEWILATVKK